MEKSVVPMVETGQGNNSATATSQYVRSSPTASSLSVDIEIPAANKEAEEKDCDHFQIRKYTVNQRGRGGNICLPFASDKYSEELLPPMVVRKSRWWRCENCLYGNGAVSRLDDIPLVVCRSCRSGPISRTTCSLTPGNHEMAIVRSDILDAPQQDKSEGRIVVENAPATNSIDLSLATDKNEKCTEVVQITQSGQENVGKGESQQNTPAILRGDGKSSAPYSYKKEKNKEISNGAVNGTENGSYDDNIDESSNAYYNLPRDDPHLIQKSRIDDQVAVKSIVFVDTSTPANQATVDNFPAVNHPRCKATRKEFDSLDEEPSDEMVGSSGLKEATNLNKVTAAVDGQLVKHPSLQIEDGGNSMSESAKHQDLCQESSEDSERPKKKERSINDLLKEKGNTEISRCGTEGSPSNSIPGFPSASASFSVPQSRGNQHENMLGVRATQKKRKTPYGQERRPMEVNYPGRPKKRAGTSKGNTDTSNQAIEISDSDSEGKVDGRAAHNSYNCNWSGRERSSLGKKKKPPQFCGHKITNVAWPEVIKNMNHAEIGQTSKRGSAADVYSSKSKHGSSTGSEMGPSPRGYMLPRQQKERKPSSTKKGSSMLQAQDSQIFARSHINHMLGEGSIKRKDAETMGTGSEVRKLRMEPAPAEVPLDLSLNSYMPSHKDGKDNAKAGREVVSSIPTGKSNTLPKDGMRKDKFGAVESNVSHNSTPSQFILETLEKLKDKMCRGNAKVREQRNYSPLPPNRNPPLVQNLDFSDPHYNEKSRGNQKNAEAMKLDRPQRPNKDFSEGHSVVEEIAELMAKNQQERLNQAERSYSQARKDDNRTNSDVTAFPKSSGIGVMQWSQRESPSNSSRKSPPSTATIDMCNMASNLIPTKRSVPNWSNAPRNFFNHGQLEKPSVSIFDAFAQNQPKVSNGGELAEFGTARNRNWQSSEQHNRFTANMSSAINRQFAEPFNRSYNGLALSEAGRDWLPMQFGDSIHQKGPNESSNLGMYAPFMGRDKGKRIANLDLNVVDLNGASLDEQNKSLGMESLKRAPAEFQFLTNNTGVELNPKGKGPLDTSDSNVEEPARQLLSLGLNKPLRVDGEYFIDTPLSACSNHASNSRRERPELVEKEFFPKSGLKPGPGESSSSFNSAHGGNHPPVKSWGYTPVVPANPYSSLFRNAENARSEIQAGSIRTFPRSAAIPGQLFGRALEHEKARATYTPAYDRGRWLERSPFSPIDDLIRLGDPIPGKDKQKEILGGVESLVSPFQRQTISGPDRSITFGARFTQGSVGPMLDQPRTDVCTLNQNPADFSYPDAGNEYMIIGEELKVVKKVLYRGKSVVDNGSARKKQRVRKTTPANERAQQRPT